MNLIDLTGQRFGLLTVLKRHGHSGNEVTWLCKCDCGKESVVMGEALRRGKTKSCGCLRRLHIVEANTKHGLVHTPLYRIWSNAKSRCFDVNCKSYKNYGGRGITVCDEWKDDFQAFYDWAMANGYKEGLSIDRIDNNGNYEPSNCRWTTVKEQSNNRRNNRYLEFRGEKKTASQWAELLGIKTSTIYSRLKYGWSVEETLTKPIKILKLKRR